MLNNMLYLYYEEEFLSAFKATASFYTYDIHTYKIGRGQILILHFKQETIFRRVE